MCPMKFRFQYVQGLQPEFISSALPFGSSIHHSLAVLYQTLKDERTLLKKEELQEVFSDRWDHEKQAQGDSVRMKAKESWDGLRDLGIEMMAAYWDFANENGMTCPENVVCVEKIFSTDLVEGDLSIPFIGIIDLILKDSSRPNLYHIIDHKTAARRYDETKIVTDMQLTAYKWLLETSQSFLGGGAEFALRWDVILKQKTGPQIEKYSTVRNLGNVENFLHTAKTILRAIDQEIFYPNPGWLCSDCGYKNFCEAWK